jgi:hypothetical protein
MMLGGNVVRASTSGLGMNSPVPANGVGWDSKQEPIDLRRRRT